MKKMIILGAVAGLVALGQVSADDSLRSTKAKKQIAPVKVETAAPADRELEVRVGPRFSTLDAQLRVGKNGSTFDLDELGLDKVSEGVQFDIDYQPLKLVKGLHFNFDMTWDRIDQSGSTTKEISNGENALLQGATTKADVDLYTFKGVVGYDVYKDSTYRLRPYVGAIGGYVDGKVTFSGTAVNGRNRFNLGAPDKTAKIDSAIATFVGGIDQRVYISRSWYVGADVGASGLDNWYLVTGDGYMGYDFSKSWGVRAGYDAKYVSWENDVKSGKAQPLLGAAYLQVVWGF